MSPPNKQVVYRKTAVLLVPRGPASNQLATQGPDTTYSEAYAGTHSFCAVSDLPK